LAAADLLHIFYLSTSFITYVLWQPYCPLGYRTPLPRPLHQKPWPIFTMSLQTETQVRLMWKAHWLFNCNSCERLYCYIELRSSNVNK